jgi:ribosomal protein L11 methyltransferase
MSGRIFKSFTVGQFTIIPAGDDLPNDGNLPVILGKKGAFGSGEHETTASCLELMTLIPDICNHEILDFGSGTGILALAAARLGAKSIVAVDLDQAATDSCNENIRLNKLEAQVCAVCSDLSAVSGQQFDTVLANIYIDILIPMANQLVEITRSGGYILLSGIPLQDKFDLVQCYSRLGCVVKDSSIGEDFVTYLLVRP